MNSACAFKLFIDDFAHFTHSNTELQSRRYNDGGISLLLIFRISELFFRFFLLLHVT